MKPLDRILERLREAQRFLIVSHVSPDFDTVASQLALKLALEKIGKQVVVVNADPIPPNMRFLPGIRNVRRTLPARTSFDAAVFLDAGTPDRFGVFLEGNHRDRLGNIIKIDHHLTGVEFADWEFVDSNRASTGELIYEVIRRLPAAMDHDIAFNIYCAIVSDTGSFRYSNTNPAAFRCAGEMLKFGVNPWQVTTNLYENRPEAELRLLSKVLDTLEISHCGTYATLTIAQKDFEDTGAAEYMTDGFINFARSLQGVEVAILIRERDRKNGRFKVSFRSKGNVNVATIAESLGGGGHHNAAGCSVDGPLPQIKNQLFHIVEKKLPRCRKRK